MTVMERLTSKIKVTDGCWLWQASKNTGGYGHLKVGGALHLAHRVSYELFVAPIPDGMQLDHLCRVRHCINPEHLEPVTQKENILRGYGQAGLNVRKTHCVHGHELTAENTALVNTGRGRTGRRCLTCRPRKRSV